ncbi:MAG: arylsulfotransferase family protein [Rhodospirillales bacterium]|nr:arylsulfotransferase family protein [Rhodospirillales bacterium]
MRYLKYGLISHDPARAEPGFTLYTPLFQRQTHLINMAGEVVHGWELPGPPGDYAYLLPGGNLMAATVTEGGPTGLFAKGGLIQELDWDGNLVWEYRDDYQHHDFRRMNNGNTLYLGWERLPDEAAARVQGGIAGTEHKDGIWGDFIREIDPDGQTIWEWHCHEHMELEKYPLPPGADRQEFAHANTVVPLEDGNILICFRLLDLVAIIDRRSGKFTWERREKDWGGPHDAQILENANMLLFANRGMHMGPRGSEAVEFDMQKGARTWSYKGNPTHTFDSPFVSGCQRLKGGNTLICEGMWGRIFEVTPAGDLVWEYISPHTIDIVFGGSTGNVNSMFRAYRYGEKSPEIGERLEGRLG